MFEILKESSNSEKWIIKNINPTKPQITRLI